MKTISMVLLAAGLVFFQPSLHAQTAPVGSFNNNLAPVQTALADTVVQVAADSQGLQLLTPDQVPPTGMFWWVQANGTAFPAPCPPETACGAIYQLADNQYLVDNSGSQLPVATRPGRRLAATPTATSVAAAVTAQAAAVVALIQQLQAQAADQESQRLARATGMGDPFARRPWFWGWRCQRVRPEPALAGDHECFQRLDLFESAPCDQSGL